MRIYNVSTISWPLILLLPCKHWNERVCVQNSCKMCIAILYICILIWIHKLCCVTNLFCFLMCFIRHRPFKKIHLCLSPLLLISGIFFIVSVHPIFPTIKLFYSCRNHRYSSIEHPWQLPLLPFFFLDETEAQRVE